MRRQFAVATAFVLLALGATVHVFLADDPVPSDMAVLLNPRITTMSPQKVLVVRAHGDPDVVASRAFGLLFAAYGRLEAVSRVGGPPAPRARWPQAGEIPRSQWTGSYALPLPDSVVRLPSTPTEEGLDVGIEVWPYGAVAEVLHVGPYDNEEADIRRLLAYVSANGYRAFGDHEEEYVKGPGRFLAGDSAKYLTIIRVRVEKVDDEEDAG
jgi:hypothetical protein